MQKIFSNLLNNALKYSEHFVNVRLWQEQDVFRLSVCNDGQIIPPEVREEIFKPFVQYRKGIRRYISGTGIGLPLACALAAQLGGRIYMDEDKTVLFQYDGKTYGPYTAKDDATAIPKDSELRDDMVGVELRQGEEILFRGGVLDYGDYLWLYNEDGSRSIENLDITVTTNYGTVMDENGNVIDPMEPSVITILDLMGEPELTHKGNWLAWFGAVFICVLNVLSILFADELFRWNLRFQIRNVDHVEPSDFEIAGRYISWTVLIIMALVVFVMGLQ